CSPSRPWCFVAARASCWWGESGMRREAISEMPRARRLKSRGLCSLSMVMIMLNKLAAIIRKDTILRFEGRTEILFFLVLPLVFTYVLGGGAQGGGGEDTRIYVPVVNEDGGERAAAFLAALGESDTIHPVTHTRQDAEDLLAGNDVGALLVIPAGFGDDLTPEAVLAGEPAGLELRTAPNSNVGLVVEQEIGRVAGDMARPLLAARNATQGVEAIRPFAGEAARAAFFEDTLAAAESALAEQPDRVAFEMLSGGNVYDQ